MRLTSLTIHETAFDELLNPIHASADLGFTVLRDDDLGHGRHARAGGGDVLPGRRARSRPCCSSRRSSWSRLRWPRRTTSRYAGLPDDRGPAPDGSARASSARPASSPQPPLRGSYEVRAGDRLDLLARAATGDSTRWWVLADANPWADATRLEQPGQTIDLPDA